MTKRLTGAALIVGVTASVVSGYIHFPPMTLQKMCKDSHYVRALKVIKRDKDKGVIVFEAAESLKGEKSQIATFKHVMRSDAEGAKSILNWAEDGKTAVMFTIESKPGGPPKALGYVFIDDYCYSVDFNSDGKYWLLIRGEPGMSACYHGSVEKLRGLIRDVLDGKEVKVPVKEPATKEDRDKRNNEINDVLKKNR
ncbi:hypothetical protein J8F10_00915 [Gemmata sp. G18]|uniref:Uncharacterized protein n=1 Tax=Gemmata palustris TaxID=2822762 RepID=A0ABS5BJI1_9BACT|nr:hypothetical protein [Gemmata palustris]MBP3953861.1 hypothetical protein [Gemmata palustris]